MAFNTTKFITFKTLTGWLISSAVANIVSVVRHPTAELTSVTMVNGDEYYTAELPEQILEKISQVELHDQQRY